MRVLVLVFIVSLFSCAQFVPPTGGKKDIIPPKLVNSFPENKSTNVKTKIIKLEFDEYLDISSLQQDLLIIPDPKSTFYTKMKGKTVNIIFNKPLRDSTTYSFYFRNGIKDISERNPASNLKLVFSTGSYIDSLNVKANLRDINTKQPILNATLALYKIDTTPISKRKPDYFIKSDSSGNINLENIKTGKFKIIAINDLNSNLNIDQKTESYAFLSDTINLIKNIDIGTLELFRANRLKNKIKKGTAREHEYLIQFDKPIKKIIGLDTLDYKLKDATYLSIFKTDKIKKDTLLLTFITQDSLLTKDTLNQKIYFTKPNKPSKPGSLTINTLNKSNSFFTKDVHYAFNFDYPITSTDSSKVIFKTDTLSTEKPKLKWTSKTELHIDIITKAKQKVELLFLNSAFKNMKGDTSSITGFSNTVLQEEDLATLSGNFKNTDPKIVQLIDSDNNTIHKETLCTTAYSFRDIIPGTYFLRSIIDSNNNGIWDPGNLDKNIQAEKILISKEPIKIKANFELKNINIEN